MLSNLNDVMRNCTQLYSMSEVTRAEQRVITAALDSLAQPNGISNEVTTEVEDQLAIAPYEPPTKTIIYHDLIPDTDVATSDRVD